MSVAPKTAPYSASGESVTRRHGPPIADRLRVMFSSLELGQGSWR
jgi:hypothetical protein